jgi:hypothetical protein
MRTELEMQKIYFLLSVLEENGLVKGGRMFAKEKGGRLELKGDDAPDSWKQYYFSLYKGVLHYYKRSKLVTAICLVVNTRF